MKPTRYRWLLLLWAIFGGVIVFFAIQNLLHPQLKYNSGIDRLCHPFDTRVRYRIGVIDERFGIGRAQLQALTNEAAQIWHDGTAQQWFVYDNNAQLTINLIYDERQATTTAKQQTQHAITQMIQSHNQQAQHIDKQRQALNHNFNTLQQKIKRWQNAYAAIVQTNPQFSTEHQRLLQQKQVLDKEIHHYQQQQTRFNEMVERFNHQAQTINDAIDSANQQFVPHQFDKGIFNGKQINIYEFQSLDDLRLTLAHELGHALGIGHNDDPSALMHPYAQSQDMKNFRLKPADIELLNQR